MVCTPATLELLRSLLKSRSSASPPFLHFKQDLHVLHLHNRMGEAVLCKAKPRSYFAVFLVNDVPVHSSLLYNHNFDHNFCIVPRLPKPHKTLKQILCAFCTRTPMSILLLPTYQSSFFFCNFTAILPFSSWWGLLSNAWAEMCVLSFKIIRSAS